MDVLTLSRPFSGRSLARTDRSTLLEQSRSSLPLLPRPIYPYPTGRQPPAARSIPINEEKNTVGRRPQNGSPFTRSSPAVGRFGFVRRVHQPRLQQVNVRAYIPAGRNYCTPRPSRTCTCTRAERTLASPRRAVRTMNPRLASDIMHLVYGNAKQRFTEPRNCSLLMGSRNWARKGGEKDAAKGIRDIEDFRFGKTVAQDESPGRSGLLVNLERERKRGEGSRFKICRLGRFCAT